MIANILVPLDGSQLSERAVPYATTLARAAHARLRLYHVRSDASGPAAVRAEADSEIRLEEIAVQLRERGVQAIASNTQSHSPAEAILDAACDPPADLIVMSTHGRGGLGRWLYGSVADGVLSQSDVPVLLISAACHHPWPSDRPLKLLVPLDGSDLSEAALGPARLLRHTLGANLLLLRVIEQDADVDWHFDPEHFSIRRTTPPAIEVAHQYLQELADVTGPITSAADVLVDSGDPSAAIAATAEKEGIDLIVMATHGRTGLARLTMGSVATTTLQRASVPILLIRPAGLERPEVEAAAEGPDMALKEAWPPIGTRT